MQKEVCAFAVKGVDISCGCVYHKMTINLEPHDHAGGETWHVTNMIGMKTVVIAFSWGVA